jgi:hypothetical protein
LGGVGMEGQNLGGWTEACRQRQWTEVYVGMGGDMCVVLMRSCRSPMHQRKAKVRQQWAAGWEGGEWLKHRSATNFRRSVPPHVACRWSASNNCTTCTRHKANMWAAQNETPHPHGRHLTGVDRCCGGACKGLAPSTKNPKQHTLPLPLPNSMYRGL